MMDAYFVTCKDGTKTAYLLGPFSTEKSCKIFAEFKEDNPDSRLSDVIEECCKIDRKASFFSYGICRIRDFRRDLDGCEFYGALNNKFDYCKDLIRG
jgi:hypothetical protein